MSRRAKIITGAVLAIVLAVVAAVLWWTLRGEEPPAVDLGAAVAQLETPAGDVTETAAVDVGSDDGGEGAAPVVEDVGAADGGAEVLDVASDVAVADDALPADTGTEPEAPAVDADTSGLAGLWKLIVSE
ncbi:MAG: hypothetical protein F4121_07675, partial [Acidimicrobiia bacterium]|nr:hypothetical protein [Acidimicrobiia bacterium]